MEYKFKNRSAKLKFAKCIMFEGGLLKLWLTADWIKSTDPSLNSFVAVAGELAIDHSVSNPSSFRKLPAIVKINGE